MAAIGGSIESVSLNGRIFSVTADADATRRLGGKSNDIGNNGDGTGRILQTVTNWSVDGLVLSCDDARGDQEFIQGLADSPNFHVVTLTYASGSVWSGKGIITGEPEHSNINATVSIGLKGVGKLTRQ
jgi:hypothetical protein